MKYVIIIPDGCADEPLEQFDGQTPMSAADTPVLDAIARSGVVGRMRNCPLGLLPGSDVATLGLLGYNPNECYTGRAPLEAAATNIELGPNDWAIRCNLVTITDGLMQSFSAGHVATEDATELLSAAQALFDPDQVEFVPGVSYRNLLICRGDDADTGADAFPFNYDTYVDPPHDLIGQSVADAWPRGPGCDWFYQVMNDCGELFADHPVNRRRAERGELPATHPWLWGQGQRPTLATFAELHGGVRGAMITAVDLLRGIANLIDWDVIEVPGATGYTDTDYAAKGRYACDALDRYDLVCVHVEATDEAGHDGDAVAKRDAMSKIDREIVGPVLEKLKSFDHYRMLVAPDHPTPVRLKTHTHGFVPWLIVGSDIEPGADSSDQDVRFDEPTADVSSEQYENGWELMDRFIG